MERSSISQYQEGTGKEDYQAKASFNMQLVPGHLELVVTLSKSVTKENREIPLKKFIPVVFLYSSG